MDLDLFPFMDSILMLGMLIVGGLGSTMGAIYGTVFIKLLGEGVAIICPSLVSFFPAGEVGVFAGLAVVVYGIVILLFLIFEPRGLAHRWETFKASYRLWPFSY